MMRKNDDILTIEEKIQLFDLLNKIAVHGSRYMSFTYQTPVAKITVDFK